MISNEYETVIGLEIHVELLTRKKAFCSCLNSFGDKPNTNKCPICEGLPGAIPKFNEEVKSIATRAGLILNCEINEQSVFDRKNYFYPDLPKGFQITQFYRPLCTNGFIDLPASGKKIGISEIHIEEDASKIVRENGLVIVDYNRCGVPLIEIVTKPDFRTANEVTEFLEIVKRSFQYSGISDCRIEQGSMRADVNLSVRKQGAPLGTRTETKNMASFKAISKAIEEETIRQISLIENGEFVRQETRRWDENEGKSYFMRVKEDAHDYKYHIEPDLSPITITKEFLNSVKQSIEELPFEKAIRYQKDFGLTPYEADILTSGRPIINLFESATTANNLPKDNCNWILTHVLKFATDKSLSLNSLLFAQVIKMVRDSIISNNAGRDILKELLERDFDPEEYARINDLLLITDTDVIRRAVKQVLSDKSNSRAISDYLGGSSKTTGFLMGKAMRNLGGKADPMLITRILGEELDLLK